MFKIAKGIGLGVLVGLLLSGCNQQYIKGSFPSFEKPAHRKHETDLIVKNAVMPERKFKYDPVEISRTEKNEPRINGRILRADVSRVHRASQVSDTGYVTYVVDSPDTKAFRAVKYYKPVAKDGKSVEGTGETFGYILLGDDRKKYFKHSQIFGGTRYSFDEYELGSFGILLIRDGNTFIYFDADNPTPYVAYLPEKKGFKYELSRIQTGDISFTRHILIKRYVDNLRMLGVKVDNEYLYDYSFLNLEKDRLTTTFPMYVDRRTGHGVDRWVFFPDNPKLLLIGTKHGPIVFSREGEYYKSINARNLWNGEKAMLFYRWHGVGGLSRIAPTQNGSLAIETAYGFETRKIDDVIKYMKENNGIDLSKEEKS